MAKEKEDIGVFWADKIANTIINRKKFHYLDKEVPKFNEFTVKTSASLSGVLHIGRLSDTIRGDSAHRALIDAGVKSQLIWVAEDMDPLRKVPKGMSADYEKYLGMPVTDVPDSEGCHDSYAAHHKDEYFKVLHEFVFTEMKTFSMREEYKKGNFNDYIKKILENVEDVKKIQNKHRTNPLKKTWSPYSPVCENCGKISTPKVQSVVDGKVVYRCQDYDFETSTAKGCSHKGEADPYKGNGKLMWKSEWAAQWARWQVSSEGAGKEYQVPNSAWWVNAEILEKVLDYPMPEPIFYEHLMIDGEKMSASVGNVVYPKDWLSVATPQLLRFYYNKRLNMTRSFSWKDLPQLYDEYDKAGKIFYGEEKTENEKEEAHIKKLYSISNSAKKEEKALPVSFSHGAFIVQISDNPKDWVEKLKKTGHFNEKQKKEIEARLEHAKTWVNQYAPDDIKFTLQETVSKNVKLTDNQKKALKKVAEKLKDKDWTEKELFTEFYEISNGFGMKPAEFFGAAYKVLLNKERGPRLAPFVIAVKEKAIKLFEAV